MVTRPRAKRPTDRGSVSSTEELFPFLKHKDWRLFSPWVKRPGREADHVDLVPRLICGAMSPLSHVL